MADFKPNSAASSLDTVVADMTSGIDKAKRFTRWKKTQKRQLGSRYNDWAKSQGGDDGVTRYFNEKIDK